MDFTTTYGTPVSTAPKRREVRVPAALNVRILGIDAGGKPFHQAATTVDISFSGARITGLAAKLNPGDVVGLQSGGGKARFKVIWVNGNRDGSYQLGLLCIEKGGCPWRENLQPAQEDADQRNCERYPCDGSASLRSASVSTPIWGSLRDISEQGCYVQCTSTVPVGEILSGQFVVNGFQINAVVEVRNMTPSVGMGVRWCDLGCDGQEKLKSVLRLLGQLQVDANSLQGRALTQVDSLQDLVGALREQLQCEYTPVSAETVVQLSQAREKLTAILKSLEA